MKFLLAFLCLFAVYAAYILTLYSVLSKVLEARNNPLIIVPEHIMP